MTLTDKGAWQRARVQSALPYCAVASRLACKSMLRVAAARKNREMTYVAQARPTLVNVVVVVALRAHLRKMRRYDPPAINADTSARMRGKPSPPGYAR